MKLYKIRGTSEWVPWDVLYNERGYNSVPCIDMAYKSISPWGTSAWTGYRTNGAGDATYFVFGKTGWRIAFNLPEALGVYPAEATPIQMIKDGVVSDAVWMEFWGAKWYLIQAEIANERYWIHELALPEYGWEIYESRDYEFILVDGTTGRVVHGVEQLNEMVFAPTEYFTIEDTSDVVFVEQSPYPIVSHFHVDFDTVQTLADGAYIDTVLPYYTSKLYIAGIVDRVAETVVDFGLTVSNEGGYVRVTNNTGASVTLTRLAIQNMDATDAEVVEVVDRQDNHAYAFKWDDGGTPYWWISYSGERHWTDALGNWSEVPSVVLPMVTIYATPSTYCAFNDSGSSVTINVGNSRNMVYFWTGNQYSAIIYDSTKLYSLISYRNRGTFIGRTGLSCFEYHDTYSPSNYLGVANVSSQSITADAFDYATCSDSTATVVTVYDSSNVAYNAFKYTYSGTDYYYVLDGTQTDWTDDLASIGYSLTPSVVLPTVDANKWLAYSAGGGTKSFSPDQTSDAYYWTGSGYSPLSYDSEKAYSIVEIRNGVNAFYGRVQLSIFNNSGAMGVRNVSDQTFQSTQSKYAVCSSNQATVVHVYNSSNVAYNAFKFTLSGTDYYYVLDGTQTDWTDDLASIGYSLYLTGWANASHTDVSLVRNGGVCNLQDGIGNNIPYNDNITYTGTRIIDSNGNYTTFDYYGGRVYLMKYSNTLSIYNNTSKYLTVQRVEYTVS